MEIFRAKPKRWGNSLGVTIPNDIVRRQHITPDKEVEFLVVGDGMDKVRKSFGTLRPKESLQKAMEVIDEGYD